MNPIKNRRKKKDIWAKSLIALNVFVWLMLLAILLVFHRVQPEFETFFDRFYHLTLRTFWDIKYLDLLIYFVIVSIIISLIGLIISRYRGRRENDHLISLLITGIISAILLLIALCHLT
ncbi:MAG: hypothetical protein KAI40_04280 [Desulfobacterales bacterium]|nr:hypothetical protein [Desulfobacterales bacterium]